MTIELNREERDAAVATLERWFLDERDERVGNIAAMGLLGVVLAEIGPFIYNRAIADAQERLHARVDDLEIELHEEPFDPRRAPPPTRRRR